MEGGVEGGREGERWREGERGRGGGRERGRVGGRERKPLEKLRNERRVCKEPCQNE